MWLTNNCNTHIAQYLTKRKQPDNKTWSINRIKINKINNFLQKLCRKWGRQTSSMPLFILKKCLIWGKKCLIAVSLGYNKNKLHKSLIYWSRDMLNFNFQEKGLGLNSPPHFVDDFSIKMFLNKNFIVWLPLLLKILGNMCITNVNQAVTSWNLKLTLSFWSSCFATWPKNQDKNLNILRAKRAFVVKLKSFFIIFKGFLIAKNWLRPEKAPLIFSILLANFRRQKNNNLLDK